MTSIHPFHDVRWLCLIMPPSTVGLAGGRMMEGGVDEAARQGVWYSMSPSPEVPAMHVIFGKPAQQRPQEPGSVQRCGGVAHARINDCPS